MSIYASTLLTRSPRALLSQVSQLSKLYRDHALIFSLSSNADPADLSHLVDGLTSFSSQTVGCLSAPLPGHDERGLLACSLAIFDRGRVVPFRSTIPGKEVTQVGRWHAFRKKDDISRDTDGELLNGKVDWEDVWDRKVEGGALPKELQALGPGSVDSVIYFSDLAPEGISNALSSFSNAIKLGLLASSTPFVTGRPVTLFHNQKVYETGAVGFAVKGEIESRSHTEFRSVVPISGPVTVTRAEGNMINEVDRLNPTDLLLSAIRKCGLHPESSITFKEKEHFALGVISNGQVCQMYNITAGDMVRGTISLDSPKGPSCGETVQFFHKSRSTSRILDKSDHPSTPSVSFVAADPADVDDTVTQTASRSGLVGEIQTLDNTFIASSENGFILSRKEEDPWLCTVPGSLTSVEWPAK